MVRSDDQIVATLLDRHGTTFAEELGIDVARNTPTPLHKLLVASNLFSARISTNIAVAAARALFDRGWTKPQDLADATWAERTKVLNESGYARYDERTSTMLGESAEHLLQRWDGDLRNLRQEAERRPESERQLLKEFKGIGDVGVDIFFREVQVAWDELFPFADDKALDAARTLRLGDDLDGLRRHVSDQQLPRLLAALVRAGNAGELDAIRDGETLDEVGDDQVSELMARTKDQLYEQAQELDISGRSKMDKRELAEAIRRRSWTPTRRLSAGRTEPADRQAALTPRRGPRS